MFAFSPHYFVTDSKYYVRVFASREGRVKGEIYHAKPMHNTINYRIPLASDRGRIA